MCWFDQHIRGVSRARILSFLRAICCGSFPKTRNIDRAIDHHLDPDSEQQPRTLAHILFVWKFCGESRRFAETVSSPCKTDEKYRGDLRRRRVHAKTAQNNIKILAREVPSSAAKANDEYIQWIIGNHQRLPKLCLSSQMVFKMLPAGY